MDKRDSDRWFNNYMEQLGYTRKLTAVSINGRALFVWAWADKKTGKVRVPSSICSKLFNIKRGECISLG